MSRASDEGVHHQPGHLAQAGPQDTGHRTRTRLPGSGNQPGPGCSAASGPVTDVLALRPRPGNAGQAGRHRMRRRARHRIRRASCGRLGTGRRGCRARYRLA
jgi:hypothetical protein